MKTSQSACYRWLHTQAAQPCKGLFSPALDVTEATGTTQDSLRLIRDFWRKVWHRKLPQSAPFRAAAARAAPQNAALSEWQRLSGSEVASAARK